MSTPEVPQTLETIEAVAEVLRAGIEETKTYLTKRIKRGEEEERRALSPRVMEGHRDLGRWRNSITMNVAFKDEDGQSVGSTTENVPHGYDKGMANRLGRALENIQVAGMTSAEAIEAALTQICGERREATRESVDVNSYVVDLQFVNIVGRDKGILPTLMLGKVENSNDALETAAGVYENTLEDGAYLSGVGANIFSSNGHIETRRKLLAERKVQIERGLEGIRAQQANDNKPSFSVWLGGLTDMSVPSQMHALYGVKGPVHMIQLPKADKTVSAKVTDVDDRLNAVRGAVSATAI